MKTLTSIIVGVFCLMSLGVAVCEASQIEAAFDFRYTIGLSAPLTLHDGSNTRSTGGAGILVYDVDYLPPSTKPTDVGQYTLCVDIYHWAQDFSGILKAVDQFDADANQGLYLASYLFKSNFNNSQSQGNVYTQGLQLALWEILYELDYGSTGFENLSATLSNLGGNLDVTSGDFYATYSSDGSPLPTAAGTLGGIANAYLATLTGVDVKDITDAATAVSVSQNTDASDPEGQETMFALLPPSPPIVPEPSTVLLIGVGLIGMAALGRKRFKK